MANNRKSEKSKGGRVSVSAVVDTTVTFLPPQEPDEKKELVSFRLPASMVAYIREVVKSRHVGKTAVVVDALRFTRDVAARITALWPRLQVYAASQGKDPYRDVAELIGSLVELGLDSWERTHKP